MQPNDLNPSACLKLKKVWYSYNHLTASGWVGLCSWLVAKHEPFLMNYVQNSAEIRPDLDHTRYPYQSYLGFPMVKDRNLIGDIRFASLEANLYDQEDLQAA